MNVTGHPMPLDEGGEGAECAETTQPADREGRLALVLNQIVGAIRDEYGLEVDLETQLPDVDPGHKTTAAIYDAAREFLLNVAKHAGVNRAVIRGGRIAHDEIWIAVTDVGRGFELPSSGESNDSEPELGPGLSRIRQRVESLGGSFGIESVPHCGTTVTVSVPANLA